MSASQYQVKTDKPWAAAADVLLCHSLYHNIGMC